MTDEMQPGGLNRSSVITRAPMSDDIQRLKIVDHDHVWHPYASMPASVPSEVVVEAHGVRLTMADGQQLIDGMSSWWSAIHGYNNEILNEALVDQISKMSHVMFGGLTHPPAAELAERLVELTPDPLNTVFFSDSGSVAVEVAIKMALQYWSGVGRPEKRRLLALRGGYHGDTFMTMSVSDPVVGMHNRFDEAFPSQLFGPRPGPRFGEAFDDIHIAQVEAMLREYRNHLAAVIIEPIAQGAGGMWFYAPAYLARLRELCDQHGVLLIADEVATGFGRTGRLFACEHSGISPDILCLGKAMTGGYLSMAATLCTREIARGVCAVEPGSLLHGPTFMGNPLAAATAVASIDLLLSQPWQEQVNSIETWLTAGLEPARSCPSVADVRILGAIGVIETKEPISDSVQAALVDSGVWLRPFGRLLYTMPPYTISETDVSTITEAMVKSLEVQGACDPGGTPSAPAPVASRQILRHG